MIYGASGPERDAGAVPDYERILAAGVNVVTTTSTTLINPLAYVPAHRERLEAATRAGGTSIYASGIEPGFLCDHLPIIFSSASRSVSKVHCYEIALYDDYGVEGDHDRRARLRSAARLRALDHAARRDRR